MPNTSLTFYTYEGDFEPDVLLVTDLLRDHMVPDFDHGLGQTKVHGWSHWDMDRIDEEDPFDDRIEVVRDVYVWRHVMRDKRIPPGVWAREERRAMAAAMKRDQKGPDDYTPGERSAIVGAAYTELLKRIDPSTKTTRVWMLPHRRLIVVESASRGLVDCISDLLDETFRTTPVTQEGSFHLHLVKLCESPTDTARWIWQQTDQFGGFLRGEYARYERMVNELAIERHVSVYLTNELKFDTTDRRVAVKMDDPQQALEARYHIGSATLKTVKLEIQYREDVSGEPLETVTLDLFEEGVKSAKIPELVSSEDDDIYGTMLAVTATHQMVLDTLLAIKNRVEQLTASHGALEARQAYLESVKAQALEE